MRQDLKPNNSHKKIRSGGVVEPESDFMLEDYRDNSSLFPSHTDSIIIQKLHDYFQRSYDARVFDLFIPPHGGDSERTPDAAMYSLCDRIMWELKTSTHRSHLILGDSGLGKTTLSLWLIREIWKDLKTTKTIRRIPLYIYLPQITKIPKWEERLLQNYLQEIGLDEKERHAVMSLPLLIILDGVDEIKLRPDFNLYKLNGWGLPPHDIKVASCCRPEALRDYSIPVLFEAPGQNVSYPYYSKYYLQLFQDTQIQIYLQQFSQHLPEPLATDFANTPWAKSGEIYSEWLTRIPSLKSLAENPFLLNLIAQALPCLVQQHSYQSSALQPHFTRNSVFAAFVDQWFSYQAKRLQKDRKLLALTEDQLIGYLKAYAKNLAASLLDVEGKLTLELLDDIQTLLPALAEPNEDPILLAHYETQGKQIFAEPDALQGLRSGCLLRTQNGKFKFLHKSLIEYLAAQQLFTGLKGEFEAYQQAIIDKQSMQLNRQPLDEIKIIHSLAEHVKTNEAFCVLLGDIVLASKDTPGLAIAAANAITILNAAVINFSYQDFRDIQIPGADLSGSFCYQTDFRGANLKGVRFHQALLSRAHLAGSDVTDVRFGEQPFSATSWVANTLAFYHDDRSFQPTTYLLAGGRDGRIYQFQSEGQWVTQDCPNNHTDASMLYASMSCIIAIHPQSALFAAGRNDAIIELRSLHTLEILKALPGHTMPINCGTFDPEGKILASGGQDCTVRLWEVTTGQLLRVLTEPNMYVVDCLAFHPKGKILASGGGYDGVRLWDVTTGQLLRKLEGHHESTVKCIGFHPEGKILASGSHDRILCLWEVATGQFLRTLQGHDAAVTCIAFNPDGKRLVSGSADWTIILWEVATGQLLQTLQGHKQEILCVAFNPDGKHIASGSWDKTVRLWEITGDVFVQQAQRYSTVSVKQVAFHSKEKIFAYVSRDKSVHLWDVTTGQLIQTLQGPKKEEIICVAFHPAGKYLASGGKGGTVRLWDVTTGQLLRSLKGHNERKVKSAAFDPEGKLLASGGKDGKVHLWDVTTGQLLQTLHSDDCDWIYIICLAFSPKGKFLASGEVTRIRIWEVKTGKCLQTLKGIKSWVNCVAFDPAEMILAASSLNVETVHLWDVATGQLIQTLQEDRSSVTCVTFHPDGKHLAWGSADNTVRLWEAQTGICLLHLSLWHDISELTFSSTSLLSIAGIDGHLTVWELFDFNRLRLQWSAKPCPKLILDEADLAQAIGLSSHNQQLGIQRGAKGQLAPASQRYQAWCSLFQPLLGTGSTSSPFSLIGIPHQRLKMTESMWVISVARKVSSDAQASTFFSRKQAKPLHVFLIIEGIRQHRRFIIRADLTSPDSSAVTIGLTPIDDFQRFQASVKQYEANQWNVTAEDGIKLLKNIQIDQQTCLAYHSAGNKSIFTFFSSSSLGKEFHSCVSWCEKQLGLIGIHFPQHWYHLFVLPPSDLTSPLEQSIVPPVSKT